MSLPARSTYAQRRLRRRRAIRFRGLRHTASTRLRQLVQTLRVAPAIQARSRRKPLPCGVLAQEQRFERAFDHMAVDFDFAGWFGTTEAAADLD